MREPPKWWQSIRRFCKSFITSWLGAANRQTSAETAEGETVVAEERAQYPWYRMIEGESIEQGDFLLGYEVFVPSSSSTSGDIEGELQLFDFVVMTQTCDIEHNKVESLLLCPWWDFWGFVDAAKGKSENWGTKQRQALLRGNLPGYHLLNDGSQDGISVNMGIVDFHEVHTAPTDQVRAFARAARQRIRLCPPYREHLAQAFARFFMRVGLPTDIPSDKVKNRQG